MLRPMLAMLVALTVGPAFADGVLVPQEGAFGEDERLVATMFFSRGPWDDQIATSGGELGMSGTWEFTYPSPDDPRAVIFGLDDPARWPGNTLPDTTQWPTLYTDGEAFAPWLMAEWRAMKWSGIDFVLADDWHSLNFAADLTPSVYPLALAKAWAELDARGEDPLPMAMLLETPFAWHQPKDGDATEKSEDGIIELWEPTRAFLRMFYGDEDFEPIMPVRALARVMVDGEARPIIHFWFPTWVEAGIRAWNEWTFEELRRLCKETFGVEPFIGVNQHVYGPDCMGGWSSEQPDGGRVDISSTAGVVDYDVAWWGGMAGPQIYENAIALGPGHWCKNQTDEPLTLHYNPDEYGEDEYRYVWCWRKVLSDPANFSRRLVIIEAWNNSDEACAINYSAPKDFRREDGTLIDRWGDTPEFYMRETRRFARLWKSGMGLD